MRYFLDLERLFEVQSLGARSQADLLQAVPWFYDFWGEWYADTERRWRWAAWYFGELHKWGQELEESLEDLEAELERVPSLRTIANYVDEYLGIYGLKNYVFDAVIALEADIGALRERLDALEAAPGLVPEEERPASLWDRTKGAVDWLSDPLGKMLEFLTPTWLLSTILDYLEKVVETLAERFKGLAERVLLKVW